MDCIIQLFNDRKLVGKYERAIMGKIRDTEIESQKENYRTISKKIINENSCAVLIENLKQKIPLGIKKDVRKFKKCKKIY